MNSGFDFSELVKKAIKYLCEGLIIGIVSYAIPKKKLDMEEVIIIGLSRRNIRRPRRVLSQHRCQCKRRRGLLVGSGLTGGIKLA
jgi:hypothetical protein